MAIMVKDISGGEREIASRGVSNAALGLGIAGTALGILNGGLFGLGGAPVAAAANGAAYANGAGCLVDAHMYYRDLINQINVTNAQFSDVNNKICALGAQVAVNETANNYQNAISDIRFANVDNRFIVENVLNEKNLALATCHMVRGQVYLSPRNLADNYISPTRVLDSHEPFPLESRREFRHDVRGFDGGRIGHGFGGCGCGGFRDGCGCDGFDGGFRG